MKYPQGYIYSGHYPPHPPPPGGKVKRFSNWKTGKNLEEEEGKRKIKREKGGKEEKRKRGKKGRDRRRKEGNRINQKGKYPYFPLVPNDRKKVC